MSGLDGLRGRLSRHAMDHASRRLRRGHADWGLAMRAEGERLASPSERLRWSLGCALASYRTSHGWAYLAALGAGVLTLLADQWIADESLLTVLVLAAVSLALGLADPRRAWLSGAVVGSVVAAVHLFGALTGVRPPYEVHAHGALHGLRWLVLILPSLCAARAGAFVAARART